jgi:hypothetical protein
MKDLETIARLWWGGICLLHSVEAMISAGKALVEEYKSINNIFIIDVVVVILITTLIIFLSFFVFHPAAFSLQLLLLLEQWFEGARGGGGKVCSCCGYFLHPCLFLLAMVGCVVNSATTGGKKRTRRSV